MSEETEEHPFAALEPGKRYTFEWSDCCTHGTIEGLVNKVELGEEEEWDSSDTKIYLSDVVLMGKTEFEEAK